MKTVKIGLVFLICVMMLFVLTACGNKYCSVSGCPRYHLSKSDYCAAHKCSNFGCNNRASTDYVFGYCYECLNH